MPSASVTTAISVKPGFFRNIRSPNRKSCPKRSSEAQPHISRVTSLTNPTLPNSRKALARASSGASPFNAVADGCVQMAADFGVEFCFALIATEPIEFHASHSLS
jgi:hypothetical protein